MIEQLIADPLEKPWGRDNLAPFFAYPVSERRIGEIVFASPGAPLLVKYLFTSEALSVQVHPDEAMAASHGRSSGKEEAWLILGAEAGARIALGLKEPTDKESLEAAARDGKIENLLDWREVVAGNVFHVPPGTIHAVGGGISLVEIQQNADITYRLYDYGRPRELHLAQAVDAALAEPYKVDNQPRSLGAGRSLIVNGSRFQVERWQGPGKGRITAATGQLITLIPLAGTIRLDAQSARPATVWHCDGEMTVHIDADGELLVAWPQLRESAPGLEWRRSD